MSSKTGHAGSAIGHPKSVAAGIVNQDECQIKEKLEESCSNQSGVAKLKADDGVQTTAGKKLTSGVIIEADSTKPKMPIAGQAERVAAAPKALVSV